MYGLHVMQNFSPANEETMFNVSPFLMGKNMERRKKPQNLYDNWAFLKLDFQKCSIWTFFYLLAYYSALSQREFLDIYLTKDSSHLLHAFHSLCYWRILQNTILLCVCGCFINTTKIPRKKKLEGIHE
jgi:hypothetical protein